MTPYQPDPAVTLDQLWEQVLNLLGQKLARVGANPPAVLIADRETLQVRFRRADGHGYHEVNLHERDFFRQPPDRLASKLMTYWRDM